MIFCIISYHHKSEYDMFFLASIREYFETSAKNKHITNDNRIAISIVDQNNPFNMASIKGKVIEHTTEEADEQLNKY